MSATGTNGLIAQIRSILGYPPLTSLFDSHIGDWYRQLMDHDSTDLTWLTTYALRDDSKTGLDVMCGGGRLARGLSSYMVSMTGLDDNPSAISWARAHAPDIDFRLADCFAPLPAPRADVVTLGGLALSMFSLPESVGLLANLRESLTPRGYLYFDYLPSTREDVLWNESLVLPVLIGGEPGPGFVIAETSRLPELRRQESHYYLEASQTQTGSVVREFASGVLHIFDREEVALALSEAGLRSVRHETYDPFAGLSGALGRPGWPICRVLAEAA